MTTLLAHRTAFSTRLTAIRAEAAPAVTHTAPQIQPLTVIVIQVMALRDTAGRRALAIAAFLGGAPWRRTRWTA